MMDILDTIKEQYGSFNKTRRRISDYILNQYAQCCFFSLREFAEAVNTTEVTVIKYCRGLGLGSYTELKKELQTHMLTWHSPGDRIKIAVSSSNSIGSLYNQIVKSERDALRDTFERNSLEDVTAFIDCIKRAKHVFVAAHNASRIPARYLVRRFLPLGISISELDLQDRHQAFYRLSANEPEDCLLIAITMPPYGKSTIALTEYCSAMGICVVSITDSEGSPVARCSKASLICHTELLGLTNSSTAMMAVINLVTMLYSFGAEDQDSLCKERLSRLSEQFDQYFPE